MKIKSKSRLTGNFTYLRKYRVHVRAHTHTRTDQYSRNVNEREIINAVREHRKVLKWSEKASE